MKDQELIRIAGIFKLLDEAENRLYKLSRQLGEVSFNRATAYLGNRMMNLIYQLTQKT
jgi:hypothetical protein